MTRNELNTLQSPQFNILATNCKLILEYNDVKFVGVINYLGNLIMSGFKKGLTLMEKENIRLMIYKQSRSNFDMQEDFDELFGSVDYFVSKRGKIAQISIPIKKHMIVLITDTGINYESIIKKTSTIFKSSLGDL